MRSPAIAALAALSLLAAGCVSGERPSFESTATSTTPFSTVAPTIDTPNAADTDSAPQTSAAPAQLDERLQRICEVGNPEVAGFVESDEIVEASGLVKATTHDGFWVLNDGADARMFAIGPKGEDRGSVAIAGVQLWDLEDMARWDHDGRTEIVLADIGDNLANRSPTHPLVIASEPDVGAETANARVVFVRYPDRAHNAEAIIIDAEANEVVVITKEEPENSSNDDPLLPAQVFRGSLEGADVDGTEILLRLVGTIDIAALRESSNDTKFHPGELSGVAGLVTGADVSPDGRLIAIRTYGSVWVWARPQGSTVAETLLNPPCEAEPPFELQGEAIAFVDDTRWATLAEGSFVSLRLSPP